MGLSLKIPASDSYLPIQRDHLTDHPWRSDRVPSNTEAFYTAERQ